MSSNLSDYRYDFSNFKYSVNFDNKNNKMIIKEESKKDYKSNLKDTIASLSTCIHTVAQPKGVRQGAELLEKYIDALSAKVESSIKEKRWFSGIVIWASNYFERGQLNQLKRLKQEVSQASLQQI